MLRRKSEGKKRRERERLETETERADEVQPSSVAAPQVDLAGVAGHASSVGIASLSSAGATAAEVKPRSSVVDPQFTFAGVPSASLTSGRVSAGATVGDVTPGSVVAPQVDLADASGAPLVLGLSLIHI